ncbi:MAG: dUTP diphosphatase [Pyrinomonadaceae bacterium]
MNGTLKFMRLHPAAVLPTRGSAEAAGLDLYSIEDVEIAAGRRVAVKTGIAVSLPLGYYGRVAPRSGLAVKFGVDVLAGVIDADYRGQLMCALINHGERKVEIKIGQRIAQLIIEAIITPQPEWAEELDATTRGASGFGSTDVA